MSNESVPNGRLGIMLTIFGSIAGAVTPGYVLILANSQKISEVDARSAQHDRDIDERLQREMRDVTAIVNERVTALRGDLERLISSNRELREEQIGELKRRLFAIEEPTNTSWQRSVDELHRRLMLLETKMED